MNYDHVAGYATNSATGHGARATHEVSHSSQSVLISDVYLCNYLCTDHSCDSTTVRAIFTPKNMSNRQNITFMYVAITISLTPIIIHDLFYPKGSPVPACIRTIAGVPVWRWPKKSMPRTPAETTVVFSSRQSCMCPCAAKRRSPALAFSDGQWSRSQGWAFTAFEVPCLTRLLSAISLKSVHSP